MHEESFFADPRNWVLIAFFLFFIIFGRKLWSALAQMLDDRAGKVRSDFNRSTCRPTQPAPRRSMSRRPSRPRM